MVASFPSLISKILMGPGGPKVASRGTRMTIIRTKKMSRGLLKSHLGICLHAKDLKYL